ncbi:MAG: type III secretion protein [Chloroflexota bacterium]|nr:MAG: type III secretion protein [Chloroflexota bacterium]
MELWNLQPAQAEMLFLGGIRLTAMLVIAPVFGARNVPRLAKIGLGMLLAYIIVPLSAVPAAAPLSLGEFVVAIGKECLVGLLAGWAVSLIVAGIQLAGALCGAQLSLGMESISDPMSGHQSGASEQLYIVFAMMIFLGTNSHHQLLLAIKSLFELLPVNGLVIDDLMPDRLILLSAQMLVVAARVAIPIIAASMVADVALAILAKIAPQTNVFFVGIPMKIGLASIAMVFTLPYMASYTESLYNGLFKWVFIVFGL